MNYKSTIRLVSGTIFSVVIGLNLLLPTVVQAATLGLSPASGTYNPGCTFQVKINVDTGGAQTDGTDAVLLFDANKITPTATPIQNGSIYTDYPNVVDAANGKLTVSGIASISQPFTGSGILATVSFQVNSGASPGPFQIKFDFDPANKTKTTDSNVVERNTVADLLASVTDGSYIIGTGTSCTGGSSSTTTTTSTSTKGGTSGSYYVGGPTTNSSQSGQLVNQPVQQLGSAGTFENTLILSAVAGIFIILGIIGLAVL